MFGYHESLTVEDTAVTATVTSAGLLLAVILLGCVTWHHSFTWWGSRSQTELKPDEYEASRLPLPPGSLGLPVIGEMLQFIVEVSNRSSS